MVAVVFWECVSGKGGFNACLQRSWDFER
jgi:hypothetical protein